MSKPIASHDGQAAGQRPSRAGGAGQAGSIAACARVQDGAGASSGSFVVAQLGQSLDGRIATRTGDSKWINGDHALTHLHRLRASVDAVVVGVGTIIADDPRLTVRHCSGQNPARVVIDPNGRLPARGKWLQADGARRIIVMQKPTVQAAGWHPEQAGDRNVVAPYDTAGGMSGVETVTVTAHGGALDPFAIVAALADLGLRRLLIEGGATTVSRFVDAGAVDRLHILVAPLLIGSGQSGLELNPIDQLKLARRPLADVVVFDDGDVLFDCELRE